MQERGYGIGPDGRQVDIPGWAEHKAAMANVPEVTKFFNEQAKAQIGRSEAREQVSSLTKALEELESGSFATAKGNAQAALASVGIKLEDTATMNATQMQIATKLALQNVFTRLAAIGGQPRVVEFQGLAQSGANAELRPDANREILAQNLGALDRGDKYLEDALKERSRLGYKFDEATFASKWTKENPADAFKKEAYKNIALRGAVPLDDYGVDTKKLIPGAVYIIEPGMGVQNVKVPTKMRWSGENFRSP